MTTVWRIGYCANPPPASAMILATLGYGSTLGNGRWHAQGRHQVVYCGASRALCQLEKRVHANGANPKDQALMMLSLPAGEVPLDAHDIGLPPDWRSNEAVTQDIGNRWLAGGTSLALWVPSFIEPAEMNLLINPAHPGYAKVTLLIERNPFKFDPRLF